MGHLSKVVVVWTMSVVACGDASTSPAEPLAPVPERPPPPLPQYSVQANGFGGVVQVNARASTPMAFRVSAAAFFFKKTPPGVEFAHDPYEASPLGTCNGPTKEPTYTPTLGGLGLNIGEWLKLTSGVRKIGLAHDARFQDPYSLWSVGDIRFEEPSGAYDVVFSGNDAERVPADTWPADLQIPRAPLLSNRAVGDTVVLDDASPVLTWRPGGADEIWLRIFQQTGDTVPATNAGAYCRLADTGAFTIPPEVLNPMTRGFDYFMDLTAYSSKEHRVKESAVKLLASTAIEYRFVRR